MSDGGKGSTQCPISVSNTEYAERWDAIFGKCDTAEDVERSIAKVNAEVMNSLGIAACFEGGEQFRKEAQLVAWLGKDDDDPK